MLRAMWRELEMWPWWNGEPNGPSKEPACQPFPYRARASSRPYRDTASPMGKAVFTIIGALARWKSSLISERVKAGMAAARARGKELGRPGTPAPLVSRIEALVGTTDMSVR
jgi:hypothetical protein